MRQRYRTIQRLDDQPIVQPATDKGRLYAHVEASTFTIEFHAHVKASDWRSFMLAVGTAGATSRWLSTHRVELTCVKRSQLQHVGYIVHRVAIPQLGLVVGVTGEAQACASAYVHAGHTRA